MSTIALPIEIVNRVKYYIQEFQELDARNYWIENVKKQKKYPFWHRLFSDNGGVFFNETFYGACYITKCMLCNNPIKWRLWRYNKHIKSYKTYDDSWKVIYIENSIDSLCFEHKI